MRKVHLLLVQQNSPIHQIKDLAKVSIPLYDIRYVQCIYNVSSDCMDIIKCEIHSLVRDSHRPLRSVSLKSDKVSQVALIGTPDGLVSNVPMTPVDMYTTYMYIHV